MWYIKETHFPPNVCQSSKFIDRACRIFSTLQRSQMKSRYRTVAPRQSETRPRNRHRNGREQIHQSASQSIDPIDPLVEARRYAPARAKYRDSCLPTTGRDSPGCRGQTRVRAPAHPDYPRILSHGFFTVDLFPQPATSTLPDDSRASTISIEHLR